MFGSGVDLSLSRALLMSFFLRQGYSEKIRLCSFRIADVLNSSSGAFVLCEIKTNDSKVVLMCVH